MKWEANTKKFEWKKWFAWHPVNVAEDTPEWRKAHYVWLETVECRAKFSMSMLGLIFYIYEYREIKKEK